MFNSTYTYLVRPVGEREAALVTQDVDLARRFAAQQSLDGQTWTLSYNGRSTFYRNGNQIS